MKIGNETTLPTPRLAVYYDGGCPLCRREISFYRQRRGAGEIQWIDLAASTGEWVAPDLRRDEALERFHVRLPDGQLAHGAKAFAEIWCVMPGFRAVGRWLNTPAMLAVLEPAYGLFLRFRPWLQRFAGGNTAGSGCRACELDDGHPTAGDDPWQRGGKRPVSTPTSDGF